MENGYHNAYAISDSDNDSVIVVEDHPTNVTSTQDCLPSSPDEPSFFHQIVQRKRKKPSSSDINLLANQCIVPKDSSGVMLNDCIVIDDLEPNICKSKHKKSPSPEINLITNQCVELKDVSIEEKPNDCIDIDDPEPYICKLIEPKRKKRLTKEEMEEKKIEEKAQKDAKKKLVEELKRLNPKECLKYITVHIDINLQNRDYSEQIFVQIQSTDAKYKIESNSYAPNSVTWSRQTSNTVSEEENLMLMIWEFEHVIELVLSNQLIEKINDLKLYKAQISLIIYITADQMRKAKSKKKNQLSWSDFLDSLHQMMLSCHVSFRFIENRNDIGLAVFNFSKSIAQKPYKLNKYQEEQEGCDWYASGHTKNCVSIDKNGNGLSQLWRQMLSQFPLCALETSEAIASVYGSPVALFEAYDKCSSRSEGESLLQDIPVRRGFGPLASNRRIGPELSKKIYTFFTDNTGCTTLSQE